MLNLLLSFLVAFLSTPALSSPYWITQYKWKIDQAPLTEDEPSVAPAALFPPLEQPSTLQASSSVSLIYQFEETAVLENLAVRHNNHLLLTATSHSGVWYLNPNGGNASLVVEFPGATSAVGIDETTEDVFVVAVGNYSTTTFQAVPGSFSVWLADFSHNPNKPTSKKITDIPEAWALNGLTFLPNHLDLVLVADSGRGWIWRVNTTSGEYEVAQENVLYTNCSSKFPLGINGIKTHQGYLHFINSAQQSYGRVAIDPLGNAIAEPEIIARAGPGVFAWDDVVLDWAGTAWIATHADAVTLINLDGRQQNITGSSNETEIQQPTSVAWGRGSSSHNKTLYIVTAGDLGKSPGQVMAVDTSKV